MRFNEFKHLILESYITEVSMAPSNLKKMAATINAKCGMEFEMLIPGVNTSNDPDMSRSPDASSIEDIVEFFSDYSGNDTDTVRENLENQYNDYCIEDENKAWDDDQEVLIEEYILYNDWDDNKIYHSIYSDFDYPPVLISYFEKFRDKSLKPEEHNKEYDDIFNTVIHEYNKRLQEKVSEAIEDQDDNYHNAFADFQNSYHDYPSEYDFLRSIGIRNMENVYNEYEHLLSWPFDSDLMDLDTLAYNFSEMIERHTVSSTTYHGAESHKGKYYVIEPDSSLNDSDEYGGVEIVSPILSLSDMMGDLHKIYKWAEEEGCYTDYSCGLHMNISIEDIDFSRLDYLKLVLFSGDKYILNKFDRSTNAFAKSSFNKMIDKIKYHPENAMTSLLSFQKGLINEASKLIHNEYTDKYVSINKHDNRIEFRSPGGDWLSTDINIVENTLYRFIVAYDIACHEDKHKEEYAKKLYKLIYSSIPNNTKDVNNTIDAFCKYNAGLIDQSTLKDTVNKNVTNRPPVSDKKLPAAPDNKWVVVSPTNQTLLITAVSAANAINQARAMLKLNSIHYPNNQFSVQPYLQTDIFDKYGKLKPDTPVPDESLGSDTLASDWSIQHDLFKSDTDQ